VQITLPDGSSHDLRHGNPIVYWPRNEPEPSFSGTYYAVDGSQLRYEYDSRTLYLPDGSRYILGDQAPTTFIDRNGNSETYNPSNKTWTDTIGRVISIPFDPGNLTVPFNGLPGEQLYSLPGVGGSSITYKLIWKELAYALTAPSQQLLYSGDCTDPNQLTSNFCCGSRESLFVSSFPDSVCTGGNLFDPVVLAEIVLPANQSYKFNYNIYGEIERVVYPSGGYERYRYEEIPAADWMRGIYAQGNRGVVERWISPKGDGLDEEPHWHYSAAYGVNFSQPYKVTITAPDGSRTERFLHTAAQDYPWGFRDVRANRAYEERTYSSMNQLLRRTLTEWTASPQSGSYANARDPQLTKEIEILLDTSGNALAQTTVNAYDAAQNIISTSKYDFYEIDQTTAQTASLPAIPSGSLLRTAETTYLVNDPLIDTNTRNSYSVRNLVHLPTSNRVIGPSGIVSQSSLRYDEYSFITSGFTSHWSDPATPFRGNVTTSSNWLNTTNTNLSTHAQYDQYGNVRKNWDARDIGLSNPEQVDYSDAYQFAYPTTATSSIPDSGVHGSNTPLVTTAVYDFNTGAVNSTTDANNQTTIYTYTDSLNRLKTTSSPDGGLTTYNYDDAPGGVSVETITKLSTTQNTQSKQFFDGLGRPRRSLLAVGGGNFITVDKEYDGMGRLNRVSNSYFSNGSASAATPAGLWITTVYDDLGRALTLTTPDNAVVRTAYDGNRVLVTDPSGKQRMSKSNALGQLKEVWEITAADDSTESVTSFLNHPEAAAGYRTKYAYDTLGNLITITQQKGTGGTVQTRSFVYNSLSRLTDATNPESGHIAYDYDENGNLLHKTDARLVTMTYSYDGLNRNISVVSSNDPASTPTVNRYYDGFRDGNDTTSLMNRRGRLWQIETSGATASRTTVNSTDAVGRPTSVSQQFLSGSWSQLYTTQRSYDFAGSPVSQAYPSGRTITYAYDAAGRISNFSGNIGDGVQRTYATNTGYDDSGRLKEEQFGTQMPLYHKRHYNIRGQLFDVRLSSYSLQANEWDWNRGAVVNYFSSNYTWGGNSSGSGTDNNGNLTRQASYVPANESLTSYNFSEDTYTYDSLNRLKSVSELPGTPSGYGAPAFTQTYDYDRFGNRTINQTLTQGNGAPKPWFSVDPGTNRLGVPGGQTGNMHYDAAGNLDNDSYSSFGSSDGTPTRTYDCYNRLTIVKDGNLQLVSTYTYNADGQRVRRLVSGVGTWQVYGIDGELLAEYQAGSAPMTATKEYGYRNGELLVTVTSGDVQRLQRFVKNLYYNALARDVSATELQQKMDTLAQAGVQGEAQLLTTARSIARGLFESSEYISRGRTDAQYVTDLYNSYLQRGPDTPGLNFWVNNTQANGRGATLNAFEVCAEFATLASTVYGTASGGDNQRVEHFVQEFYYGALQREPTSTEMQQQTQRLNNASAVSQSLVVTEAQAMGGEIFLATNYNSSHTTEQYVTDLYEAFLQRAPDGPGLNFWVNNTQANGRPATLAAFKVCAEYAELAGTLYREAFWLVGDHLGTPRMEVDKSGSLSSMKRHDYLPFGEELGLVGGRTTTQGYNQTDNERQKFTQKERDSETGLDYFLARYYSSKQGRFTSPDEFAGGPDELFDFGDAARSNPTFYADVDNPQSLNKYQYTYNNPTNLTDEDGHCPPCVAAVVVVVVTVEILSAPDTTQAPTRSRTEPRPLPTSGDGITSLMTNATVGVVGGPLISKAGRGVLKLALGEGTEVVERAMSKAELQATRDTGLVRGGREEEHFVTNSVSKSATKAQQRLALRTRPEVGVQLEVPKGIFSAARRVKPLEHPRGGKLPGGGLERTATGKIPARVIRVRRLDKQ